MCASVLQHQTCALQSSVRHAHSCSAPLTRLEHVRPSAFLRPDGHCLQHDGREPTAMLAALREYGLERPPFPQMSPQHCRPKGRLLKTCLSLALKSRPWCRFSTLPGQTTSCISRDKDEKPWADQLAPELPADSTPAPVPSQDALPAKRPVARARPPVDRAVWGCRRKT